MDGSDRRRAARHVVPPGVIASVNGISVELTELSLVGAKLQHSQRFPLSEAQLTLRWEGRSATLPMRVARSEVVGRSGSTLLYGTGIFFTAVSSADEGFIASVLRSPDAPEIETKAAPARPSEPVVKSGAPSLDDTWTRSVSMLRRDDHDDELPYAQFRLTEAGWRKDYVSSPAQPADGFTIARDRRDFDELQRTYEAADDDLRRMIRNSLAGELPRG